jgi:hypothetical protein
MSIIRLDDVCKICKRRVEDAMHCKKGKPQETGKRNCSLQKVDKKQVKFADIMMRNTAEKAEEIRKQGRPGSAREYH